MTQPTRSEPDQGNRAAGAAPQPDWAASIRRWASELGFARCGFADLDLAEAGEHLRGWLAAGLHGEMDYMVRSSALRTDPAALLPGAASAIMVAIDYAPADPGWIEHAWQTLSAPERAYVSRYALGRDYHKVVRMRLARLAERVGTELGSHGYRVCCDSAPVMEVELARKAGLGWRGKHTLLLSRNAGSAFFLGTLLTDLALPPDAAVGAHCGSCTTCIEVCPTRAIVAPYRLDARRCISYLTIESHAAIPPELRPLIGNRIYGCDDCQLACPWNRYAQAAALPDFAPRHGLDCAALAALLDWSAADFELRTRGSPIRRIGHERWLRNVAVALGNAVAALPADAAERAVALAALGRVRGHPSGLVREHVEWALAQGAGSLAASAAPPEPTMPAA